MIYFDNAATTWPKPQAVADAVAQAMRKYGANPGRSGHKMSLTTAMKIYEVRELAAEFFGANSAENVVFTQNCTHALNIVIRGLLMPGDHVIMSELEHNSVLRPVHALAERGIISYSIAPVSNSDNETVASFASLILPNTKLIICTHGSNVWGIRPPVKKLGKLAFEKNIFFLVDAAQTAGVINIDVNDCAIDFLCTAGHKSLYGPSGTGLLITARSDVLDPLMEGGTGSYSTELTQPEDMPEKFESGTVNAMGIIGLGAGIRYIKSKGLPDIYKHEMTLGQIIYRRLQSMPAIELYTDFESETQLPVLSFNIAGMHSEDVAAKLSDKGFALRGGLHCAPFAHRKMGTLERGAARISIGIFNTTEQAMALCNEIKRIAVGR